MGKLILVGREIDLWERAVLLSLRENTAWSAACKADELIEEYRERIRPAGDGPYRTAPESE